MCSFITPVLADACRWVHAKADFHRPAQLSDLYYKLFSAVKKKYFLTRSFNSRRSGSTVAVKRPPCLI
ncbi:hypothetical protein ALQ95_100986 [Pseudomonas syringae pv. ribicola]|uniref:Uncharacterized protein n=1 Tax=Pseudomonas syringae pv. ribicola TaxID=55398 RepID=A0A3M2VWG2_PSESI|nr:hypothetical protein ALQ95_100986 [Pseudomonas syringae pv. ribicola]